MERPVLVRGFLLVDSPVLVRGFLLVCRSILGLVNMRVPACLVSKPNSAPGPDGLRGRVLKENVHELKDWLFSIA